MQHDFFSFLNITVFLSMFFTLFLHDFFHRHMVWAITMTNLLKNVKWQSQQVLYEYIKYYCIKFQQAPLILENRCISDHILFLTLHVSFQLHAIVWVITMTNVVRNVTWQHQKPVLTCVKVQKESLYFWTCSFFAWFLPTTCGLVCLICHNDMVIDHLTAI